MGRIKKIRTRVTTVTCPFCHAELFSRARHDYRECPCKKTMVDGGFDYLRFGWDHKGQRPMVRTRYVNVTRATLYDDWNSSKDRYGFII